MKKIIVLTTVMLFSFILGPAFAQESMPWEDPDQKPLLKSKDSKADKGKEKKKKAPKKKSKKKKAQQNQK